MSKHPKRCSSCDGRGIHTWTERNGTARGVKCQECKGSGIAPSVTPITDSPSPIPELP